jgi:iron complex outermembrane receptor protein
MLKELMIRSTLIALVCSVSFAAYAMADTPRQVDVPAGSLIPALEALAKQEAVELLYQPEQLKSFHTRGVKGSYTPQDAVRLLLKGTPLELRTDPSGAMVIAAPDARTLSRSASAYGTEEGKNDSSDGFLMAQVDQGQASSPSTVEKQDEKSSEKKKAELLQEVLVTGSRLKQTSTQGPQELKVYSQQQIEQSGQTTVADFLNTLPDVSQATVESQFALPAGGTTVQLHGLPLGTTLVLINGRRVEASALQAKLGFVFFDLGLIPASAVERIEVLTAGSSAIYGSDALAGVVNVILKQKVDGLEFTAKYGSASDINDTSLASSFGKTWESGAASAIVTFQTRGSLNQSERGVTGNQDFTRFGGPDDRLNACNPGNVFSVDGVTPLPGLGGATYAAVPHGFTGAPTVAEFRPSAGTLNACNLAADLIPARRSLGLFVQANQRLGSSVELFAEFMLSHEQPVIGGGVPFLFGQPGFQQFTVSAANPYNPFGTTVGISNAITGIGPTITDNSTVLIRPVIGVRGSLPHSWDWEVSSWVSQDWNHETYPNYAGSATATAAIQNALNSPDPATALNPFIDGPMGSPTLLRSLVTDPSAFYDGQKLLGNAFIRGPLWHLPGGDVQVVIGGEYDREKYWGDDSQVGGSAFSWARHSDAIFAEGRIPILPGDTLPAQGPALALTVAGRYDHYSDFGGKKTPQFGVEWRPTQTLLVRANYGEAFRAPALSEVFYMGGVFPGSFVTDPLHNGQPVAILNSDTGNRNLKPETGSSHTFGLLYSSDGIPGLQLSIAQWSVVEANSIQFLGAQTIVNNENLFPGDVIRTPAVNGQPGTIVEVINGWANYGRLEVAGMDYDAKYVVHTPLGDVLPSLSVSETYRYRATLVPGAPTTDRVSEANSDGNWAPRWKGNAALGWKSDRFLANISGRYVSRYEDYDGAREIGNFWLCDASVRFNGLDNARTTNFRPRSAFVEFGGVNVFNRLPQFSNVGFVGYDYSQADIRGRFLYARVGIGF